jgi:hypothetical protein
MRSERTKDDEVLFSPAVLALGRIHWLLLRSAEIMDKNRFAERRSESGFRVVSGFTEFGEEVGLDEIQWWVFQKELNRHELHGKTTGAHALQRDSANLRKKDPESYKELLTTLRDVL